MNITTAAVLRVWGLMQRTGASMDLTGVSSVVVVCVVLVLSPQGGSEIGEDR